MLARAEADTVQLKIRMKEPLRAALERAAEQRGVSMNAEIVARLERSSSRDAGFGGPRLTNYAYLMASSFALSGQRTSGIADEQWLDDDDAFRAAVIGVMDALLRDRPLKDAHYVLQALVGRVATREAVEKSK